MTDDAIRPVGGDGGRRPVVGYWQKVPLHPEQIALMMELQALFLRRLEERREEGDESPEAQLYWEGSVEPDLSDASDEKRKEIEARIEETRADPEWRARLKRLLEANEPDLARLMEVDPEGEG
jgi:hypothetical protein